MLNASYDINFVTSPKIICQTEALNAVVDELKRLGVSRLMLITDAGLVDVGLVQPLLDVLEDVVGLDVLLFTDVLADPPEVKIEEAIALAKRKNIDGVLGFGGGSSMDTAKLVALLASPQCQQKSLTEVYGVDVAQGQRLPLIQVPTTAGTGSEVTTIAIVTTPSQQKMGVVSPLLLPDVAILDATNTVSLPAHITAMTGVDAMVHAIESYTSKIKKNPITDALAVKALQLLFANIDNVLADGGNLEARSAMLLGSCLAGICISNAPVGAVHALAYPLGGLFHMPHGHSNSVVLPGVLRFNASHAEQEYAELARALFTESVVMSTHEACTYFIEKMAVLVERMPFSLRLSESGVCADDLDKLATDAMKVERLLQNNPRPMTYEAAYDIYQEIL